MGLVAIHYQAQGSEEVKRLEKEPQIWRRFLQVQGYQSPKNICWDKLKMSHKSQTETKRKRK